MFQAVSAPQHVAAPDSSALIQFNIKFREAGEAKDAIAREAKAARKAAGKAAQKKMASERSEAISSRKAANRAAEAATEKEMLDSLNGESWGRVVSLIDIHAGGVHAASGAAASGKEEKKAHAHASTASSAGKGGEAAVGNTSRMKDILIALKTKPLAAA